MNSYDLILPTNDRMADRSLVAGVDEAGRGPLAGPVVAAAVILDETQPVAGLADSKKLTAGRREELAECLRQRALAWAVGWADAAEIDAINVLQASMLAMRRAVLGLGLRPGTIEVDGNRLPEFDAPYISRAIVGGDASVPSISAASIIAKVERDRMMQNFDRIYPNYGFARHKGYGTAEHTDRLLRHGPCQQHRRSFRPLRQC